MTASTEGAVLRAGDRKQGRESGQDQIWRNSEVGSSAPAEQNSAKAEQSLSSVILGEGCFCFSVGKLRHHGAFAVQGKSPEELRVGGNNHKDHLPSTHGAPQTSNSFPASSAHPARHGPLGPRDRWLILSLTVCPGSLETAASFPDKYFRVILLLISQQQQYTDCQGILYKLLNTK